MDDLIRRQDAIEAIQKIEEVYFNNLPTLLDKASVQTELMMLPSAQPNLQPTCNQLATDCISRQAAIDEFYKYPNVNWTTLDVLEHINALPSAQPERHFCRECKWCLVYANVYKYGDTQTFWYCQNWCGETDEEGFCYEWERREDATPD